VPRDQWGGIGIHNGGLPENRISFDIMAGDVERLQVDVIIVLTLEYVARRLATRATREVDRNRLSSPHLEGALGTSREVEIVGDEDASESFRLLQLLEQAEDLRFGIFVEIARRLVVSHTGAPYRQRIPQLAHRRSDPRS
jgi:hypothetical protein